MPDQQAQTDAVPILAAMKAIPLDRRLDALAVALDAYCKTYGTLELTSGIPGPSSGPCAECDTPHLFGERCAPEAAS